MSRVVKGDIVLKSGIGIDVLHDSVIIKYEDRSVTISKSELVDVSLSGTSLIVLPVITNSSDKGYKASLAQAGTLKRIIASAVNTILNKCSIEMKYSGVGFKAEKKENGLFLLVGKSHPVYIIMPEGVEVSFPGQGLMTVSGFDKQKVSQFAASVKKVKKVEPYKGKGICIIGDHIIRKDAKAGKK